MIEEGEGAQEGREERRREDNSIHRNGPCSTWQVLTSLLSKYGN